MAVYTEVSKKEARSLLRALNLGELSHMQACTGGIENTNYFVTSQNDGVTRDYVLTLFERLTADQLPFYLHLMKHFAQQGIAVPEPQGDSKGKLVFELQNKPAAVVTRLRGQSVQQPTAEHCAQMGATLARLHLAGQNFALQQPHLRGLAWWNDTVPQVLPFLDTSQADLMNAELALQNHLATSSRYNALPRGPIHADLFLDNVLFTDLDGKPILSGIFDFYFAGVDTWLFDMAVCLNVWCVDPSAHIHQPLLASSFIASYNVVRPLEDSERALLPAMLRAAALRFWISRLWDQFLPRQASVLEAHDPAHFERVLRLRAAAPLDYFSLAGLS
ncbi:MAG: homoserine kinase [Rhodoferax sp.]|uniref:homoserine kinase n=1 Tax=Rhodoferax sp. TaxID=50421 RepID=UPI001B69EBAF|nr:homoserine kinase [Rhodoferax sp.]MBP9907737.1 homoserine kinase [Rhodoferax sp.]